MTKTLPLATLPAPLNDFQLEQKRGEYKDFQLKPGDPYPLKGVTYAWSSHHPRVENLAALFSILNFIIGVQIIEFVADMSWFSSTVAINFRESGFMFWWFTAGVLLAAAFLVIPALRKRSNIFVWICRIAAMVSLALLFAKIFIMTQS